MNVSRWFRTHPSTSSLIAASIVGYLLVFFAPRASFELFFGTASFGSRPWSILTYPFVDSAHPLNYLLGLWWTWVVASELESRLGAARLALVFLGSAMSAALGLWIWAVVVPGASTALGGLTLGMSGLTVVWCLFNPGRVVLFSFLIPIPGRILGLLTALIVFFSFGRELGPLGGLFALGGCLYGYLYVQIRRRVRGFAPTTPPFRARPERLTMRERYRLWRARRRMRKVWDSERPDDVIH